MRDLGRSKPVLNGTDSRPGDFPLGSIESRAAARASCDAVIHLAVVFGDDPHNFARLETKDGPQVYERLDGQTQEQFHERMMYLPGRKRVNGTVVTFYTAHRPTFPD